MGYLDETLVFTDSKIYYVDDTGIEFQVMMDWEDSIMQASANYVCENGGDVLEIGFGMGLSAGYIQANDITSHTIVENHPQVIAKAKQWAKDKPNVTIVEGDWYDVKDSLGTYDGVFYDTWDDDHISDFTAALPNLVNAGAKVTWWNNNTDTDDYFNITGTTYTAININPDSNIYFKNNIYYLPKKQF
tara:strand:+ start:1045 stop:1608 length:564 start_codon:yes stop_codon:yes gene_type:complete